MRVILFTGYSGVGKSDVARLVADRLHAPYLNERVVFRVLARSAGFERGRDWLAAVGFESARIRARVRAIELITAFAQASVVVFDGAYDAELPDELRRAVPSVALYIVFIEAPRELRLRRVATRRGASLEIAEREAQFLDQLKDRAGMRQLCAQVALTLNNIASQEEACARVLEMLQEHRHTSEL